MSYDSPQHPTTPQPAGVGPVMPHPGGTPATRPPRGRMILALTAVVVLVAGAFVAGMAAENYRIQRNIGQAFAGVGDDVDAELSDTGTDGDTDADAEADAAVEDAPSEEPTDDLADTEDETASDVAAFGQSYTYEDGLEVTVSTPEKFSKSEMAAGGESSRYFRKFTVTITNGTDTPFDPSSSLTSMTAGGVEGDEIYDGELGGAPSTRVLPGKKVSYEVGYGLDSKDEIVVQVTPSFDYSAALFQ